MLKWYGGEGQVGREGEQCPMQHTDGAATEYRQPAGRLRILDRGVRVAGGQGEADTSEVAVHGGMPA